MSSAWPNRGTASILADHTQLLPVARAAGVTSVTFHHEDLRLFFESLIDGANLPLVDVLCSARTALQREHFWDPEGPIGFGCICRTTLSLC